MKIFLIFTLGLISSFAIGQNSLNMDLLSSFDPTSDDFSDVWGYVDEEGNEYAITGTRNNTYIVDVTDCSNPVLVHTEPGFAPTWRDYKTYGDYAYSVCDSGACNEGFRIYDLSALPSGDVVLSSSSTTWFTKAHNIFVDEPNHRLYVCEPFDGNTGTGHDYMIFDLSVDPANPVFLAEGSFGGYFHDMNVKDNIMFVSNFSTDAFEVYDANDPNNVTLIESLDGMDGAHASWNDANENYAYLIEEKANHQINVIDMANLHNNSDMSIVGQFWDPLESDNGLIAHNLFIVNDFLYISHYEDGVKVYDISSRLNPTIDVATSTGGYYDIYPQNGNSYSGFNGTWGIYPFFPSGCLVASDDVNGLNMLQLSASISDTCTPVLDLTNTGNSTTGTYSASNYVYSDTTIPITADVTYQAEIAVELKAGFNTRGTFEAKIAPCLPSN